jgi:hypothetical protein
MNFVLDQYRKAWGWMLGDDRTTWLEVFDTRWSHCHQWAGCPTWQMSRYLLGLQPHYDLGIQHFLFVLNPGSLKNVQGMIPVPGGVGVIKVKWTRQPDGLHYHLETPVPIFVHFDEKWYGQKSKVVHIGKEFDTVFKNL